MFSRTALSSTSFIRFACFSTLAGSLFCGRALQAQQAKVFREDFSGLGKARVESFSSPRWDIAKHVRARQHWLQVEAMQAAHGLDTAPPPATHRIDRYEDTVYTAREHLMTALKAETYGLIYLTPNALADFRDGECVIRFDVSTLRTTRRDWLDVWLTPWDDNMQLPLEEDLPDLQGHPRKGVQLRMELWNTTDKGKRVDWTHFVATRFDNYVAKAIPHDVKGYEAFLTPSPRKRETIEIRVTRTSLKIGMPKYGLWWVDAKIDDLGFDRAVVQFGHHSYNPLKSRAAPLGHDTTQAGTGSPSAMSWHWDDFEIRPALRFDMIHAKRRFVLGSKPEPVLFERPAPAGSYLRFAAHSDTEVSFDRGPFQKARRQDGSKEARNERDDTRFSSYWMPIPEGTERVDVRMTPRGIWKEYRLDTMAKDFAIWSLPVGGVGCAGTGERTPDARIGAPRIGNASFAIDVREARAQSPAVLLTSSDEVEAADCALRVSLAAESMPTLFFQNTDARGSASIALPIPNDKSLVGAAVYAQWAIVDPAGGVGAGALRLALSPLRRILLRE